MIKYSLESYTRIYFHNLCQLSNILNILYNIFYLQHELVLQTDSNNS